MKVERLAPAREPLDARVRLPGSKSLTIRALVAAALSNGTSRLSHLLIADDTRLLVDVLSALGFELTVDEPAATAVVHGSGGHVPATDADLYGGDSGATVRFATALAALGAGVYRIDGSARMRERPIGALVDALNVLGAHAQYEGRAGYPPVIVRAAGLRGGHVALGRAPSSQMVSALLMAAPAAHGDLMIEIPPDLPSRPYVRMTLAVMEAFAIQCVHAADAGEHGAGRTHQRIIVPAPQAYRATEYAIEPDASAASYFLAAPAIAGGRVVVEQLGSSSPQGDAAFVDLLEQMGCGVARAPATLTVEGPRGGLRGIDADLSDMPDVVPTLAVVACFAEGPTHIRNVGHLRVKESDRLRALAAELSRLGAQVEEHSDGLTIGPPRHIVPARIRTYNDHRIAMAFALPGLAIEGIEIEDPDCVSKSFPGFFEVWKRATARPEP